MRAQPFRQMQTDARAQIDARRQPLSRVTPAIAIVVLLPLLALLPLTQADAYPGATPSFIRADNCTEHQAFFDGDPAAVAARLHGSYTAETDPASGHPMLFARAEHCQVAIGSASFPVTMGVFGIIINSPDGRGCSSGAPGAHGAAGQLPPVCNWFPIEWVANDQRVVDWLQAGSPGPRAVLVPGLSFKLGPAGLAGTSFNFSAAAPAPSPFSMQDSSHPGSATINVRGGYWFGGGPDAKKIAFSTDDITPGQAEGTVSVAPGSEAAKLLGGTQAAYASQYTSIAAEHWGHGSYRAQFLGEATNTDSFSGSCSLSGVDTFTPPASNIAQDLHVSYDAKGTCSGTLDGQPINNASVSWLSEAHSYGSCSQANTVEPGAAALRFAGGAVIQSTFDFSTAGTQINMSFYGTRSGFASGQATFLTPQTGPDAVTGCAGSGDRQVPMDLSLSTDSPLVSPGVHAVSGNRRSRRAPALQMAVRPQIVPAGALTTLRFLVTAGHRPVRHVVITFDGHRLRTNFRGAARLRLRLNEPGVRTAMATKRGFRRACARVRVVGGRR